jgi:hypothetical protein
MRAARWFADRECIVKGHPLVWHTLAPSWLLDMAVEQVAQAVRERIQRDVTNFASTIDMWDAINEVVIMLFFDKYDNGLTQLSCRLGRIGAIRLVVDEARSANPVLCCSTTSTCCRRTSALSAKPRSRNSDRPPRHSKSYASGVLGRRENPFRARTLRRYGLPISRASSRSRNS